MLTLAPPTTPTSTPNLSHVIDTSVDRRPSFWRLVQTEFRKMADTRSGRTLLGAMIGLTIAIPVIQLIVLATGAIDSISLGDFILGAQTGVFILLPVMVILMVTSEWTQRTAMTTFALVPARPRVIAAKIATALGATALGVVLTYATAALAMATSAAFGNRSDSWHIDWAFQGISVLSLVATIATAFAFATLILNSAGVLVAYFALQLLIPVLFLGISQVQALSRIVLWVEPSAWQGELEADPTRSIYWAHAAVSSLIWIVVPAAIGVRRILRTEIK